MADVHSHKIKRLTLELQGLREEDAREMQDRMRQVYLQRIIPLLDRYLSQVSPNGYAVRMEKLEFDLGNIRADDLETDLVQEIESQLRRALPEWISEAGREGGAGIDGRKTSESSQWEVFQYFMQTGSLPWWTDGNSTQPVLDSFRFLLTNQPTLLTAAMRRWIRREDYLRRLIRQLPPEALLQLVRSQVRLSPADFDEPMEGFFQLADQFALSLGLPASNWREESWRKLIHTAFLYNEPATDARLFWRGWLLPLAAAFGVSFETCLAKIRRTVAEYPSAVSPRLSGILRRLAEEPSGPGRSSSDNDQHPLTAATELDRILRGYGLLSTGEEALLRSWLAGDARTALSGLERATLYRLLSKDGALRAALGALWASMVEKVLSAPDLSADGQRQLASWRRKLRTDQWSPSEIAGLLQLLKETRRLPQETAPPKPSDAFNRSDDLFVQNAGLVILWPFLPRFFTTMGLVEDGKFVDEVAAHRAAGLLQYLADGQVRPPEYLLGFNKILCGLPWDEVHDFGEPVNQAEAAECEALLQAVIANAPVLKNMSVDGFRGSFLLRRGVLKPKPDLWELHVERQTYDIVLDRFPWSWKIVKLPWMEKVVAVEWNNE